MTSDRGLAVGLAALALACLVGAGWLFDHHYTVLAGLGGGLGVLVAGLAAVVGSGRGIDHDPAADNLFVGVLLVFGSVAGFGLVVGAVMLFLESLLYA